MYQLQVFDRVRARVAFRDGSKPRIRVGTVIGVHNYVTDNPVITLLMDHTKLFTHAVIRQSDIIKKICSMRPDDKVTCFHGRPVDGQIVRTFIKADTAMAVVKLKGGAMRNIPFRDIKNLSEGIRTGGVWVLEQMLSKNPLIDMITAHLSEKCVVSSQDKWKHELQPFDRVQLRVLKNLTITGTIVSKKDHGYCIFTDDLQYELIGPDLIEKRLHTYRVGDSVEVKRDGVRTVGVIVNSTINKSRRSVRYTIRFSDGNTRTFFASQMSLVEDNIKICLNGAEISFSSVRDMLQAVRNKQLSGGVDNGWKRVEAFLRRNMRG